MSETVAKGPPLIHPTAIVDSMAELGEGVQIGPYSIIGPHVQIGAGTVVGSHVLIEGYTTLGERNQIFHSAAIGSPPQDFSYKGERSFVRIGDENIIREFVTMQPGSEKDSATSVGDRCLVMAYAHVAHNCVLGDRVILANAVQLAGHVTVEDWAAIGGIVPVHQFVRVGTHAFVGGGSRVPMDVAPYTKMSGSIPQTHGLNTIGLRRRGFSEETIQALKLAYRLFFRSNLTVPEACARIRAEVPDLPEVRRFVAFVESDGRGIIR